LGYHGAIALAIVIVASAAATGPAVWLLVGLTGLVVGAVIGEARSRQRATG